MTRILNLINLCLKTKIYVSNVNCLSSRQLYTKTYFGIDNFIERRGALKTQFGEMKEKFFERMENTVNANDEEEQTRVNLICSEDLKNVAFLTEDTKDMELLQKMIKKYTTQNDGLRFSDFVFGPVIMRLCHLQNNPELAFSLITDNQYGDFFQQISTYTLAADLLFKNGKYEEILKMFDHFMSQPKFGSEFPKLVTIYVFAACYRINTKESFNYAQNLMKKLRSSEAAMFRRSVAFCAALALKRGDAAFGLEVLSLAVSHNFIVVSSLRVAALCDLGRVDDAVMILMSIVNEDVPRSGKANKIIFKETFLKLKEAVGQLNDNKTSSQFKKLENALQENNLIEDKSFDETIFELENPIPKKQRDFLERNERSRRGASDRGYTQRSRMAAGRKFERPGILYEEE